MRAVSRTRGWREGIGFWCRRCWCCDGGRIAATFAIWVDRQALNTSNPQRAARSFRTSTWVQANIAAHRALLRVLNGGGPIVSTGSGVVTLNLLTHRCSLDREPHPTARSRRT